MFGQGKTAATLLTEDGCHFPVIARESYRERRDLQSTPFKKGWGARPMHQSTLTLSKAPWTPDYTTTTKQYFGGSKSLNPAQQPLQHPSMHISPYYLTLRRHKDSWDTNYSQEFSSKSIIPASLLHETSMVHSQEMRAGQEVKAVVKPTDEIPSYWSQYNRIHSKLGYLLGPGVQREYPVRKQYNFITGEMEEPAWKTDNKKVSRNRVLHTERKKVRDIPVIN